jgi:hypothetical protein
MVECKASKTVHPAMAGPLQSLRRAMGGNMPVHAAIVHQKPSTPLPSRVVAPEVEALDVREFVSALSGKARSKRIARTR